MNRECNRKYNFSNTEWSLDQKLTYTSFVVEIHSTVLCVLFMNGDTRASARISLPLQFLHARRTRSESPGEISHEVCGAAIRRSDPLLMGAQEHFPLT